jgi:hypothetical protein
VDERFGTARVALVSNEMAMADHGDMVLHRDASGLTFDLLVEPELEGRLWWIQIGRRVVLVEDRRGRGSAGGVKTDVLAHARAGGNSEERQHFKQRESEALARLATANGSFTASGGDEHPLVLDPAVLGSRAGEPDRRFVARWLAAARLALDANRLLVPPGSVAEAGLIREVPGCGMDLRMALRPLAERALSGQSGPAAAETEFHPGRVRAHDWLERSLADQLVHLARTGFRVAHLVTHPEQWIDGEIDCNRPASVECTGLGRMQLIRHCLEVSP